MRGYNGKLVSMTGSTTIEIAAELNELAAKANMPVQQVVGVAITAGLVELKKRAKTKEPEYTRKSDMRAALKKMR